MKELIEYNYVNLYKDYATLEKELRNRLKNSLFKLKACKPNLQFMSADYLPKFMKVVEEIDDLFTDIDMIKVSIEKSL